MRECKSERTILGTYFSSSSFSFAMISDISVLLEICISWSSESSLAREYNSRFFDPWQRLTLITLSFGKECVGIGSSILDYLKMSISKFVSFATILVSSKVSLHRLNEQRFIKISREEGGNGVNTIPCKIKTLTSLIPEKILSGTFKH